MSPRRRVGLLFGGPSVEHEVSVISARGVSSALDPTRFECVPLGVTGDGRWIPPELSAIILGSDAARVDAPEDREGGEYLVIDPGGRGVLRTACGAPFRPLHLDVIFPVLHGWGGEDGKVQGLLELAGVPYVGAGVAGSAVGMDKEIAKEIFRDRGLPVGPWRSLTREEHQEAPGAAEARLGTELGYPLFIKPANGGSSVGISKVGSAEGLRAALEEAFACDRKAVIEAALEVREIEVAVIGNERPEASVAGEILPSRDFYDYASKYLDGSSRLVIPAPLEASTAEDVRRLALAAFRALDLAGMARVDFFIEKRTGQVLLNEVNTLPGFTPISMYPRLWEASGLSYPDLLDRLIVLAMARWAAGRDRATRWKG